MAAFHILPLVQDCIRMSWRVPCMFFSKTSVGEKLNFFKKPKKPLSAFKIFKTELAEELKKKSPLIQPKEISITARDMWNKSSEEEKMKYYTLYEDSLEEYSKKMDSYVETDDEVTTHGKNVKERKAEKILLQKRLLDLKKPKKPLTPFFRFLQLHRNEIDGKNSLEAHRAFAREMGKKWLELSDAEKEKYKIVYIEERKQFEKKLKEWEEDMIDQGNFDVIRQTTLENINPKLKTIETLKMLKS